MIVRAKGGSKQLHLSEEEITLDALKECGHILHAPNISYEERITIVSFPSEDNAYLTALMEENKLYTEIQEEVTRQLQRIAAINISLGSKEDKKNIQDLKLEKVKLSEVFVQGLGKLIIER